MLSGLGRRKNWQFLHSRDSKCSISSAVASMRFSGPSGLGSGRAVAVSFHPAAKVLRRQVAQMRVRSHLVVILAPAPRASHVLRPR